EAPPEEDERERRRRERDVVSGDDPGDPVDRDVVLREQVREREHDDRRVRERDRDRPDERREPQSHYAMWISTSSATPPRIVSSVGGVWRVDPGKNSDTGPGATSRAIKRCHETPPPMSPSSQKLRCFAPRISRGPIVLAFGGTHDQSPPNE